MQTLVVGFDSAWSAGNAGAISGVVTKEDGYTFLGIQRADFEEGLAVVEKWQDEYPSAGTLIFIDQPTIVKNESGQRPVERIVSSPVGRLRGGVQPANRNKVKLFGDDAPIWTFLNRAMKLKDTEVYETYPVLTLMAKEWFSPKSNLLPKYNPQRKTFSLQDWAAVCRNAAELFRQISLERISIFLENLSTLENPKKYHQDCLDSCLCLLPGLEPDNCMRVGNTDTGYMVVPANDPLMVKLCDRCQEIGFTPNQFVQRVALPLKAHNSQ